MSLVLVLGLGLAAGRVRADYCGGNGVTTATTWECTNGQGENVCCPSLASDWNCTNETSNNPACSSLTTWAECASYQASGDNNCTALGNVDGSEPDSNPIVCIGCNWVTTGGGGGGETCGGSNPPSCNGSCGAGQNCVNTGEGNCECRTPPGAPPNLADVGVTLENVGDVWSSLDTGGTCGSGVFDLPGIMVYRDNGVPDGNPVESRTYNQACFDPLNPPRNVSGPASRLSAEGDPNYYYIVPPPGYQVVGGFSEERDDDPNDCWDTAQGMTIPGIGSTQVIRCEDLDNWENVEMEFTIRQVATPTPAAFNAMVQGRRRILPACVNATSGSPVGQEPVTAIGYGSSTNEPYSVSLTGISASGTTTVNIDPNPPVGYSVYGYDLCYNSVGCHSCTAGITRASSVVLDNSDLYSLNYSPAEDPFHYADLYWYYCTNPNSPTNIQPSGSVCLGATNEIYVSWTAPSGGASRYSFRADDRTNPWRGDANGDGLCDSPQNAGDVCLDITATGYYLPVTPGHTYDVWVHARNSCDGWSNSVGTTVTAMGPLPTPGPVTVQCGPGGVGHVVAWGDNSTNESGFRITRSPVPLSPPINVPANTTTATAPLPTPGQLVQYYVSAYNSACPGVTPTPGVSGLADICQTYVSWFQTGGGGEVVAAAGNLGAVIPTTAPTPYLLANPAWDVSAAGYPQAFGDRGVSGWAGNLNQGTTNVSRGGPLVDISTGGGGGNWASLVTRSENQYSTIRDKVMPRVSPIVLPGNGLTDQATLTGYISSAGPTNKIGDVVILTREVPAGGNFDLSSTAGLAMGSGKVLLFVEFADNAGSGRVNINGNIDVTDGSGFFGLISEKDVYINPAVAATPAPVNFPYQFVINSDAYAAHLEGIFYSQGQIRTGSAMSQLKVDGSLIGMGGVYMERTSSGPNAAEFVKFNPRMTSILREVGLRRRVYFEQVNP